VIDVQSAEDTVLTDSSDQLVEPACTYRHYKGQFYEVVDIATHTETLEKLVVYRPLYGEGKLWVRPLAMFVEMVEVDGVKVRRFTRQDLPQP
jgi:hypothetical protein